MKKACMQKKGFALLEVLVAVAVLGLVAGSVMLGFHNYANYNTKMEIKTGAIQAAQQKLEELRLSDLTLLPNSGSSAAQDLTTGDHTYQVTTSYCTVAAYCPSNNTRHFKVSVKYQGKEVYATQTVYTRLR